MTLAIDFDGVIADLHNVSPGKRMGEPVVGALEALESLYDAGHEVIIHTVKATTQGGRKAVEDWLDHYGADYHAVTAVKPNADIYLDDRAVRFVDWSSALVTIGLDEED